MTYKTILVHVDDSPDAAARIDVAAGLALAFGAHLIGTGLTGVSRLFYQEGSADLVRTALAPYMDELYRKTERALADFSRRAAQSGVPSHEARLVDDETGAGLALCGRYADLLVLGQSVPGGVQPPGGDLAAYVLMTCPRPLLVLPHRYEQFAVHTPGKRIMVAWNGSPQAVRAVTAALPLLRRAEAVTLVVLGTPDAAAERDRLLAYLARQGVAARFVAEPDCPDPGERLLSLLADAGADLLVMGGYGHTRLGELLLGGATRTVLRHMTAAVLLAH